MVWTERQCPGRGGLSRKLVGDEIILVEKMKEMERLVHDLLKLPRY